MNPKLQNKVNKIITDESSFGNWSRRLVRSIQRQVKGDLILPQLNLRSNAHVSLTYPDDDTISLVIGPRDMSFDRKTGECIGTGVMFGRSR